MSQPYRKLFVTALLCMAISSSYGQGKRIDHPDGGYDIVQLKGDQIFVYHYNDEDRNTGGDMFSTRDISYNEVVEGLIADDTYGPNRRRKRSSASHLQHEDNISDRPVPILVPKEK